MKNLSITLIFVSFVYFLSAQDNPDYLTGQDILKKNHLSRISMQSAQNQNSIISNNELLYFSNEYTSDISIRLDSVIITGENSISKEIRSYDANGNLTSSHSQFYENGSWFNSGLINYTYDANGNILTILEQQWDNINMTWDNNSMVTFSYDINNNRLASLSQYWQNDMWKNNYLVSYTYDSNDNILTHIEQDWHNDDWQNKKFYEYTYNNQGINLTRLEYYWDSNSWIINYLTTHTYDNDGNKLTSAGQYREDEAWINQWKYDYSYDNNGNTISEVFQVWENEEWIYDLQIKNTFDNNSNRINTFYQVWTNDAWKDTYYSEYIYDENNNCVTEINNDWEDDDWVIDYKIEYSFLQGEINATVYIWDGENWQESQESEVMNIVMEGEVMFSYWARNLEIYYSEITGIEEAENNSQQSPLICYPNPASENINLKINSSLNKENYSFSLFNQAGQEVKYILISTNSGSQNQKINVSDLANGFYIMKISDNTQSYYQKLIITR